MSDKKFQPGSFMSSHAWGGAVDFANGGKIGDMWGGTAAPINGTNSITTSIPIKPWHTGGLVNPSNGVTSIDLPSRYVEVNCLFCNTKFSTPVGKQQCWAVICLSCKKWFRLHMLTCDPECDSRVDCLIMGIMSNIGLRSIIDITGIRAPEIGGGQWIVNPNANISWGYNLVSDLYVIKYESPYYACTTVQDNGFKGDPFQLPDVSKR